MNGLPEILACRTDATHSELDIAVQPDNPWFEGHFPQQAILPGVVQIGWALHFAGELHGFNPAVHTLEQIKFKHPILPDMQLSLHLVPTDDGRKLRYEYRDAVKSYSSGTFNAGGRA